MYQWGLGEMPSNYRAKKICCGAVSASVRDFCPVGDPLLENTQGFMWVMILRAEAVGVP